MDRARWVEGGEGGGAQGLAGSGSRCHTARVPSRGRGLKCAWDFGPWWGAWWWSLVGVGGGGRSLRTLADDFSSPRTPLHPLHPLSTHSSHFPTHRHCKKKKGRGALVSVFAQNVQAAGSSGDDIPLAQQGRFSKAGARSSCNKNGHARSRAQASHSPGTYVFLGTWQCRKEHAGGCDGTNLWSSWGRVGAPHGHVNGVGG